METLQSIPWSRRIGVFLAVSIAAAVASPVPSADAQGPPVPFVDPSLVNVWTGLNDDNLWPAIAYNQVQDEFLVVWQHWAGGAASEIYAQRVARNGALIGPAIPVAVGLASTLPIPAAVAFAPTHEGYLVVYPRPVTVFDFDIAGRWVAWDGTVAPTEITIADGVGSREAPDVAYNPIDDEFLVVWENVWLGGDRDIDARRLNAETLSSISWANVATGPEFRITPHVAFDRSSRKYLITYNIQNPGLHVAAKLAVPNLLGISVAPEIDVCVTADDALGNGVATANGEFLVVWTHLPFGTSDVDIRARRVSNGGGPQGPAAGFPIETYQSVTSWGSFGGDVSPVPGYGFVVVWSTPGSTADVWGSSILTGNDAPWGTPFSIDTSAETQAAPAVAAATPEGEMLVVYEDGWSTGDVTLDLRAHHFGSGVVVFGDDFDGGTLGNWAFSVP